MHSFRQGRSSPKTGALLAALLAARKAFTPIRRAENGSREDREGRVSTYRYADLRAHLDAVEPALLEAGILLEQEVESIILDDGTPLHGLVTRLTHVASGEWRETHLPMQSPAARDPHESGSRLTYARRQALALALGLSPVGEDDDGRVANAFVTYEERQVPQVRPAATAKTAKAPAAPAEKPAEPAAPAEKPKPTPNEMLLALIAEVRAAPDRAPELVLARAADLAAPEVGSALLERFADDYVAAIGAPPPAIEGVAWPVEIADAA